MAKIIGLDCDDVLFECTEYAIELVNESRRFTNERFLCMDDIKAFGRTGTISDAILPYFTKSEFYMTQKVYEDAREFICSILKKGYEIAIITSVPQEFALIRKTRVINEFPELNPSNIFCVQRKDLFYVDAMLDDAVHNLVGERRVNTPLPVVFDKPWNRCEAAEDLPRAKSYDDFLKIIDGII